MGKIETIEKSINALENTLKLRITIIDNAGAFHTNQGVAIFDSMRQSHKKNQVCKIGFSEEKCRGHCRFVMNAKCAEFREAFVQTCWKGVNEIVIPLQRDGIHYGMLYAGQWRQSESLPPTDLPEKFYAAYEKLSILPESERIEEFKSILTIFATGILGILKELNAFVAVSDVRGNMIMEFIKDHAVEKIELADLATRLNLSCSRTSYLIRNILNKSFPELLNEERLQRVKTLLVASNMTLNEIAVQTGFNDEYYLSRMFKLQNGQTPGQYKKLHTHINPNVIRDFTE